MTVSSFNHVQIRAMKTVIPDQCICIDDELKYFDNNLKKLARAKKMIGYGNRYVADELTTVTDMAVDAAEKLFAEMPFNRDEIDALIFVNQKPDYKEPNDACIAHGRLGLSKTCAAIPVVLGCSGYIYGLWLAHSLIEAGASRKCLLLAGDVPSRVCNAENRKTAPLFGDAASATLLQRQEKEERFSCFSLGCDGSGWDKLIVPFGGTRLPIQKDVIDLQLSDSLGNKWGIHDSMMKGEDVFNFTMDVVPALIRETMKAANWTSDDVDLLAIHQANKQIVENIISKAEIPQEKAPVHVFSKYGNNSTNSVVTVLCDQEKSLQKVLLCAFGIGLSWGAAAVDLSEMYNGGISVYIPPKDRPTRKQQIQHWMTYFKGEEE